MDKENDVLKNGIGLDDFYLLHITSICYDDQAPKKEALENVLSSLRIDGINFIFLIDGHEDKIDFYYGISKDLDSQEKQNINIKDIGDNILMPSIQGNFRGSHVKALVNDEKDHILKTLSEMNEAGMIIGVPSSNKDDEKYQSIDKLINIMYGDRYCFLVIAKPLNNCYINQIEDDLMWYYNSIAPLSKMDFQEGNGTNSGTSRSSATGRSNTDGSSHSTTKSGSETKGTNESNSESASLTCEFVNRPLQYHMKLMDDFLFPRLDYGKGKGLFFTSIYVFASKSLSLLKIKNTVTALYSGKKGNYQSLMPRNFSLEKEELTFPFQFIHNSYNPPSPDDYPRQLIAQHYINNGELLCGNWITTNELGMIAGLPQKEVVGLSLN